MVKQGDGLGLVLEPAKIDLVGEDAGLDHLQRHRTVQAHLAGLVDDAHPATTQHLLNLVVTEVPYGRSMRQNAVTEADPLAFVTVAVSGGGVDESSALVRPITGGCPVGSVAIVPPTEGPATLVAGANSAPWTVAMWSPVGSPACLAASYPVRNRLSSHEGRGFSRIHGCGGIATGGRVWNWRRRV